MTTTVTSLVSGNTITQAWVQAVYNDIVAADNAVSAGSPIIELATTPAGTTNQLRWSTVHQTLMKWTGTQWIFAGGTPSYFDGGCTHLHTGFTSTDPGGATWGAGLVIDANFRAIKTTATLNSCRIVQGAPAVGHQGVLNIGGGTAGAANSGVGLITGQIGNSGDPGLRFRGVFQIVNPSATTTCRVGFLNTITSADATNGAYLEVNNVTATFKTSQASTRTSNATTATLVANTWYTVHIWFVTSSSARCIILKDDGTVVLDVTNSANVPSISQLFGAGCVATNSAILASTDYMSVDWLGVGSA